MTAVVNKKKRVTTRVFQQMKNSGEKISMVTAYDYSMARIVDMAGIDAILVGDSACNTMLGYDTTLPITLEHMIYHAGAVVRGARTSMVIADLPFGSYQGSVQQAYESAVRMMKEAGVQAVKLEGGIEIKDNIQAIIRAGIPVMGHLGLTPQSVHKFGDFSLRAKEEAEAQKLLIDAHMLEEIGCFALVLEKVPANLAEKVAKSSKIPVIGIGAGNKVDGQVLVIQDMLGMTENFNPKFVRKYLNLFEDISNALKKYDADVKSQSFPNESEQY